MKKASFLFLIVMLFVVMLSGDIYAAKHPTAGVVATNDSDLNVRSGPGNGYEVIACLPKGCSVKITSVSGSWYKVSANGVTGYCYSAWIKVTENEEVDYSTLPKKEQEKIGRNLDKSAHAANLATTVAE